MKNGGKGQNRPLMSTLASQKMAKYCKYTACDSISLNSILISTGTKNIQF